MTHLKKCQHFVAEEKVLQYYRIQQQILAHLPSQVISVHEKCNFAFKNDWQNYLFFWYSSPDNLPALSRHLILFMCSYRAKQKWATYVNNNKNIFYKTPGLYIMFSE